MDDMTIISLLIASFTYLAIIINTLSKTSIRTALDFIVLVLLPIPFAFLKGLSVYIILTVIKWAVS